MTPKLQKRFEEVLAKAAKRDAAKEKQWDHTRTQRKNAQRKRWNDAAQASGFESWSDLLTQLSRGNVTIDRKVK